jgi:hypothetical protein
VWEFLPAAKWKQPGGLSLGGFSGPWRNPF